MGGTGGKGLLAASVEHIYRTAMRMRPKEFRKRDKGMRSIRTQQILKKYSKAVVSLQAKCTSMQASQKK